MRKRNGSKKKGRLRTALSHLVLVLPCLICANAWAQAQPAGSATIEQPAPRRNTADRRLDDRVKLLTQELQLDTKQQSELRALLQSQRDEIRRLWRDNALPAANRIGATRAISERTADQIRAMLNEEQRKKYNLAKPPRDAADGPARPDVEYWMNPRAPKQPKSDEPGKQKFGVGLNQESKQTQALRVADAEAGSGASRRLDRNHQVGF